MIAHPARFWVVCDRRCDHLKGRRTPLSRSREQLSSSENFDHYVKRAEELIAESLVTSGTFNVQLKLTFDRTEGFSASSREPDETQLRSYLLTLRKFVSADEPVFVNAIQQQLYVLVRSDEFKRRLGVGRAQWRRACCGEAGFVIVENGQRLEPETVMDLWINGLYFHNDSRKEAAIERLDPLGRLISRHAFLNQVITASNYVLFLAQVIIFTRRQGLLD